MDFTQLKKEMLQGYNTYNNNSVLSHVLMPEAFAVNLGFKFYNTGRELKEALIGRFGENDEKIHPPPRSYDGSYTELNLKHSDHEMIVQCAAVDGRQYILVTPIKSGIRPATLLISAAVLWNRPGHVEKKEDHLEGTMPGRVVTVYTDGQPLREMNTGLTNPYLSVVLDRPVAISTDGLVGYKEVQAIMATAKEKLTQKSKAYGDLAPAYEAMATCMAWDTIYEPENDQICSPVSRLWSIGWGGYVLFCWDTYFSGMLAMIDNKNLAYANVIAITHEKTESGFVPNFGAANDDKSRDRSQPPVGSLAVKEIYRIYKEKWIVEYLYDELLVWNRWFAEHRMLENGQLCWGSDPYEGKNGKHWEKSGVNELLGAALESGLDNSPMYDDMPFDQNTHIMGLADVGLTGLYIMDCEALAELANLIGRPEAAELLERAEKVKDGLQDLWDEDFGLFCNKRTDNGEFSHRISPTNFYAFFSDRVTDEQAKAMIEKHFYNEEEFFGAYIMPSIARNDPAYPDQDYWRGRIWAPMNFLAYLAMRKKGLEEPCRVLAEKSKELLLLEWNLHGHVHENYDGDTGMGCGVGNSDKFYHWGALLSLIALIDQGFVSGPEKALLP